MKELIEKDDKRMTVREVAAILGVSDEAIKKHIRELYPDLMQERVTTYLNEEQITAIKQRMRLTTKVANVITDLEAAEMLIKSAEHFRVRFEQERRARITAEKRAIKMEQKLITTENMLTERTTGLSTYQRIAETGGLVLSDYDDLVSPYRGRR